MVTAIDTETELATNEVPIPRLVCTAFCAHGREPALFKHDNALLEAACKYALEGRTVFANGPYDLAVLGTHMPALIPVIFTALEDGRVHDVLTRSKLIDIGHGRFREEGKKYGLDDQARKYLGVGKHDDTWKKKYALVRDMPLHEWPEDARLYAKTDAQLTIDLFVKQEEMRYELGPDLFASEAAHVRAHFALYLCSAFGIRVDHEAVEALDRSIDAAWARARALLIEAKLVRADGTKDTKAAEERVRQAYSKLGVPVPLTDGGKLGVRRPKTDALTTEGSQDPVLEAYSEYVSLGKMRGTFIANLRYWSRVRPVYDELLFTGRTSCSGFPLQQLPRAEGVRECLVADPGCCLISVDGDAAELVAMAQIETEHFGSSLLGDAINAGRSPHWILAAAMLGLSTEQEAEEHELGAHTKQEAKKGNFGFLGGMGAATFVVSVAREGVYISVERAKFIRDAMLATWGLKRYLDWINENIDPSTRLGNCVHKSGLVRSKLRFTQMANGFFQERTAQVFKHALWTMTYAVFMEGLPMRPVGFMHDEILGHCAIDDATLVGREMSRHVVEASALFCPDVRMTASPAAMLRLSKKAKTVYLDGKLIPWEHAMENQAA